MRAYENLPVAPSARGSPVEIAVFWCHPESGAAAVMLRFPEGYREPRYGHTTTYHPVYLDGPIDFVLDESGSFTG